MGFNKSQNENFEVWYQKYKDGHNLNAAATRFTRKTSGGNQGGVLENAVQTILDAVDTVVNKQNKPQRRMREDTYRKMVRRLDLAERQMDKKKRTLVVFGILTLIGIISTETPLILIFGSILLYKSYTTYEHKRKILKLAEECRGFEDMNFPDERQSQEKAILQHAYSHNGKVYPEVIALESEFSLSEIEHMLAICVDKHIATIELDDNGRTYYYFASFDTTDPYADLNKA